MAKKRATSNAVRANITIPADVRASMDAVKETVNWSAVATEAFRAKLVALESRKAVGDMSDVIERLRATKKKHDDEMYQEGREVGGSWAKEEAEAFELKRLADFAERAH